MKLTHVAFDFDGTIADSISTGLKVANSVLSSLGLSYLSHLEYDEFRNMTHWEIIKKYHVPIWKIPRLINKLRDNISHHIDEISVFYGMEEVFEILNTYGLNLFVISSNEKRVVNYFLKKHCLDHFFKGVYTNKNIFNKAQSLELFIKKEKVSKSNIIYIGDEIRDIEACEKVNIPIISATWGFHSKEIMQKHNAQYIAEQPLEILQIIDVMTNEEFNLIG